MTLFSDLTSDFGNLYTGIEAEAAAREAYLAYLANPPVLPDEFADQSAYDTYDGDLTTWTANCAATLATWNAAVSTLDGYIATIVARIPVAEVYYTVTRRGASYSVGKFVDENGNYALRWKIVPGSAVVRVGVTAIAVTGYAPTVTGA